MQAASQPSAAREVKMPTGPNYVPGPAAPTDSILPKPVNRNTKWLGLAGLLGLLAVIALVGTYASGLLKAVAKQPDKVLATTAKPDAPVMQFPINPPPPVVAVPTPVEAKKNMPDDVRRWLEHLAKTERDRGALSRKNLGSFTSMMPMASMGMDINKIKELANENPDDPSSEVPAAQERVAVTSAEVRAEWKGLRDQFNSFPAPPECREIAANYGGAIDETGAMIGEILGHLENAQNDPNAAIAGLTQMQKQSGDIDQYGKQADKGVEEICEKYDTRKWFSISSDFGGGGLLGMPSLG